MKIDNELIEKIKNDGRAVVNNVIKKENLDFCKEIINKNQAYSKSESIVIPVLQSSLAIKLLKLQFKKIFDSFKLIKISKNLKLQEHSDKVFRQKTCLDSIDLYMSKKSNDLILPWHCDQAYSGKIVTKNTHPSEGFLKFFFYLTDVGSNNGCLGYIPKSHTLTYCLKICFYNNELKYEPFWKLSDMRKLVSKDYVRDKLKKYLKSEVIDEFMINSNFVEKGNKDTYEYDLKADAGDVVIFNELGFHRAASPAKNDRYALRYFYKKIN